MLTLSMVQVLPYFEDCDIVARYTAYKSDGCYTAPRTYASTDYGMVFNECRFTAEEGVGDQVTDVSLLLELSTVQVSKLLKSLM